MKRLVLGILLLPFSCLAMEKERKWDAQLYDANSKQQYEASLESIKKFDLSSPDCKAILELGCNTANVSNTLAQEYPNKIFVAIDPEKDAIELGKIKHSNSKNLMFIRESAQNYDLQKCGLPLANLVGCYYVLHWIKHEELPTAFKNIAKNLAEGGILSVIASAKQDDTPLAKAVRGTLLSFAWCHYWFTFFGQIIKGQSGLHTLLTVPELKKLGIDAGLKVSECIEKERCFKFSSRQEFESWLVTILKPHGINSMTDDDQKKFVNDVVDLYLQHYNTGQDGVIEYRYKELDFTAHKTND